MSKTSPCLFALIWGVMIGSLAQGATVTVESATGGRQTYPTAQAALTSAKPGDVITLGDGVHYGPLVIQTDRVTLRGTPGAVVNGNTAHWRPQWKPEPGIAPLAFSSAIPFEPGVMSVDGRSMIRLEADRGALVVHRDGVGRAGRNALGACFTYLAKDKRVVISFAAQRDPSKLAIEAAPDHSAAITIKNAAGVTVEDLTVTGATSGILLTDCTDSTVQRCLVHAADAALHLYKGATRCKLLHNDVTWAPDALSFDIDRDSGLAADDVWMAHKRFGTYDKWGIKIDQAGPDNQVAYNYVFNVFNGIQNEDGVGASDVKKHFTDYVFQGKSPGNDGLEVHHNRVDLTMDDALEPGNELVNNRWHANLVTRGRCATRFKTVTMGPFYFYDNVLIDCSDGLRLYKSSPDSAQVFIYNNFVRHPSAIIYHAMNEVMWGDAWLGKQMPRGTPGFRLFNNVFVTDQYFANNGGNVRPNFKSDFNVFTTNPDAALLLRGFDEHSVYHVDLAHITLTDGRPSLAPAAIAQRTPANPAALGASHNLPGWEAADRTQPGPSRNALKDTPTGPVSGRWESVSKLVNLDERDPTQTHLTPMRWLYGKDLRLLLVDLVPGQPIDVAITGAILADNAYFTAQLLDDAGQVIQEIKQASDGDRADAAFTNITPAGARLEIHIQSKGDPQWLATITRGNGSVAYDGAFAGDDIPGVRKYDGGSYTVLYRVTPQDASVAQSFTVSARRRYDGAFGVTITRPDGVAAPLAADGVVPIRGQAGDYRIAMDFTKKADLGVAGPSTVLRFAPDQPTPNLRVQWGKPAY
jgi:hypothetical protein